MKRPVREIDDDLLVGIPLVLLASQSSDRLDSKMMGWNEVMAIECLESTREPVSVSVEGRSQVFVGIRFRTIVEKYNPRVVIESPLFVRVDDRSYLDERGGLNDFREIQLEIETHQKHEHSENYRDRHQENGGDSIRIPAVVSPIDQDVKNALFANLK
jgi:hypothetical protein